MIDTIKICMPIEPLDHVTYKCRENLIWNSLVFIPKFSNYSKQVVNYESFYKNLRITIFDQKMYVENSWHKFFKGNNYSDYTFSDIKKTIDKLALMFGKAFKQSEICNIAIGLVIDYDAEADYEKWNLYKRNKPESMTHRSRRYGSAFRMNDYKIKGYNKSAEIKFREKISDTVIKNDRYYRIECEYKYMRCFNSLFKPCVRLKVEDLTNKLFMESLLADFISKYEKIENVKNFDFVGLKPNDIKIVSSIENPLAREALRDSPRTYSRYIKKYNQIANDRCTNDFHREVLIKLKKKSHLLLNM